MKHYLTGILFILICINPAFSLINADIDTSLHTTNIENIKVKKYLLSINYITIENNINAQISSDTAINSDTLKEYMKFARNTPSYKFYVIKKSDTLFMITYLQKNEGDKASFYYEITDLHSNQTKIIQSNVWGEITEKRVDEMIFNKYDPASIKGAIVGANPRQFLFNNMIYGYQDYERLKDELIGLIEQIVQN